MYDSTLDHFDALIIESVTPLFLLGIGKAVSVTGKVAMHLNKRNHPATNNQVKHRVLANFMLVLFYVLPVISRRICQVRGTEFSLRIFNLNVVVITQCQKFTIHVLNSPPTHHATSPPTIRQSYRCVSYDAGDDGKQVYLVADPSVDCNSDRYTYMAMFASVMMLICE